MMVAQVERIDTTVTHSVFNTLLKIVRPIEAQFCDTSSGDVAKVHEIECF